MEPEIKPVTLLPSITYMRYGFEKCTLGHQAAIAFCINSIQHPTRPAPLMRLVAVVENDCTYLATWAHIGVHMWL